MKYALNDKQLELLKQVAAASNTYEPLNAHSGVLWALTQRELVQTSRGPRGRQVVVLTADGRFYLKHGKHPKEAEEEKQRLKNDPAQAALAPANGPELLTRIREANGSVTVPCPGPKTRARWRAAYYHALHHGHVPQGCKLRFNGRDKGDMVLRLLDEAALKAAELPAIPAIEVPDQLPPKPHALITRTSKALGRSKTTVDTRDRPDVVPIHVSRHLADRALRIAHALITEAERRGYEVTSATSHHRGEETHRLVIRIAAHDYPWEITERTAKVPHEPTLQELRDHEKHPWNRIPKYDHNPNGQLMIASPHRNAYYSPSYSQSDGARWVLEDRLGHLLRDLEERAERAEEQCLAAEQAEAARRRNWYRALRQAREAQIAQHRSVIIAEQARNWRLAEDIRAFCAAAREADSAADWMEWAEQYATSIDPLARPVNTPADPPATQQALREHFGADTYAHPWPFNKAGQWSLPDDTTKAASD
ncbi:hypothetical protein ACIO93_42400 [Streptomyces sp. NPDC087903]|uniref:hypothetical protein n=1 Tax=Streptomyces sp. NPDC087903 TaxID=3365819 RepID=UPI00382CE82A